MNKNFLLLTGIAAAAALMMAVFVQSAIKPSEDMVKILVTRGELPAGDTARASDFEWTLWPKQAVPPEALVEGESDPEELDGKRVINGMLAGQPVISTFLVNPEDAPFLEAKLSEGKRAVSIGVDAESMVAGFVRPGSFVDVQLTYEVRLNGREERAAARGLIGSHASETVLTRVRVLAVDQDIRDNGDDAKPAKTVTLEVTQEQAEMLNLAREMGTLSLVLRRENDDGNRRERQYTTDAQVGRALQEVMRRAEERQQMLEEIQRMQAIAAAPAANTPTTNAKVPERIRIYHGGQTSEITY